MDKRQELLREYVLECIRSSEITLADLTGPKVFDKLLKVISKDAKQVFSNLGREGLSGLLLLIGSKLSAGAGKG